MSISHDSVNRFLHREAYTERDLYNEAKLTLNLKGGTLSVDDSVLDKPYTQYMAFVGHFWSGKHHRTVKGINLIKPCITPIVTVNTNPLTFVCTTRLRVKPRMTISRTCLPTCWRGGLPRLLLPETVGTAA